MGTLSEIEAAVEELPRVEQAALLEFVARRLRETAPLEPRRALLEKWRKQGTSVVDEFGGTQGYLDAVRGRDDDRS